MPHSHYLIATVVEQRPNINKHQETTIKILQNKPVTLIKKQHFGGLSIIAINSLKTLVMWRSGRLCQAMLILELRGNQSPRYTQPSILLR